MGGAHQLEAPSNTPLDEIDNSACYWVLLLPWGGVKIQALVVWARSMEIEAF
jgi:hypothetical protein